MDMFVLAFEGVRQNHPDAHFAYVGVVAAEESMVNKAWAEEFRTGLQVYFVRSRGFPGMSVRAIPFGVERFGVF